MRSEKSINNIKYNLVFFFLTSIFVFISRAVFIRELGSEITGLNSLFTSIVGFLNLAELGIVNVIVYSLYAPLNNNDQSRVLEILYLYKTVYRIVGTIVLILGILVSFRIDLIAEYQIDNKQVQYYFLLYLLTIYTSYLFTYKYAIAVADQNAYIVTKIEGILKVVKSIIQILSLIFLESYFIWLVEELLFGLISYYFCNKSITNKYPWINEKVKFKVISVFKNNKAILNNTGNMFFHKIGSFVVFQTDNILLAKFVSLKSVAIYTNYYMIVSLASNIVAQVFNGLGASIGNLITEDKEDKAFSLWKTLQSVNLFIAIVLITCIYLRIEDFINIWVGEGYLLPHGTLILILINLYFLLIRGAIGKFKDGYGIFWDKFVPVIESLINLAISWYLVIKIGLPGVLVGTLASNLFVMLFWTPFIVFKTGFHKHPLIYHIKTLKILIRSIVPVALTIIINRYLEKIISINDVINFVVLSIINLISITVLYSIFLFREEGAIDFYKRIVKMGAKSDAENNKTSKISSV